MASRSNLIRRLVFGLVVVLLVVGAAFGSTSTVFSYVQTLLFSEWFVVILLGLYVTRPIILVPLGGLHLVAGFAFGGVLGGAVALVGTALTSLLVFATGFYLRPTSGIGGWLARRGESSSPVTGDLRGMVAVSLSPVPADIVSYSAGAAGVPFRVFIVGLVLGEVPWVATYVLVGNSMKTLSTVEGTDLVELVIVLTALSILVVARPAYDALRSKEGDA